MFDFISQLRKTLADDAGLAIGSHPVRMHERQRFTEAGHEELIARAIPLMACR
jgi:hypothetical protein